MANLVNILDDDDDDDEFKEEESSVKSTRGTIPALLLKARTDAHLTHLRQKDKTLATHNAMSIFYEGVLDLVDTYIETSMGIDDSFILEEVDESEIIENPLEYFKALYDTIAVAREVVKESFIQNQIDTMQELIAHTLYRIKNIVT
jgi:hypothetical protein